MNDPFPNGIPFNERFSTNRGRRLANRLYLSGKGSETLANNVSAFFWNLCAAITVEKMNEWKGKNGNTYAHGCLFIHKDIISSELYYNLPQWVREDVNKAVKFLNSIR